MGGGGSQAAGDSLQPDGEPEKVNVLIGFTQQLGKLEFGAPKGPLV